MNQYRQSRDFACDARCAAHSLTLSLECYYWSGDEFHYNEALKAIADLVKFMDKMKETHERETKSNEGEA